MTPDADLDVARLTPSPPVTEPQAAHAVRACLGLSGALTRLPGEADDNFLLDPGGQRYVVKFAHLRADPAVVDVQVRVLRHVESAAPGLPVPRVRPAGGGGLWTTVPDGPLAGQTGRQGRREPGELFLELRAGGPSGQQGAQLGQLGEVP